MKKIYTYEEIVKVRHEQNHSMVPIIEVLSALKIINFSIMVEEEGMTMSPPLHDQASLELSGDLSPLNNTLY